MTVEAIDPDEDNVHVYPVFPGERVHDVSLECWCDPRRDEDTPNLVVHNRVVEA